MQYTVASARHLVACSRRSADEITTSARFLSCSSDMRHINQSKNQEQIEVGGLELYYPLCRKHYLEFSLSDDSKLLIVN